MAGAVRERVACPMCRADETYRTGVMTLLCNACGTSWRMHAGQYIAVHAPADGYYERTVRPCACGVAWVTSLMRRCAGCGVDRFAVP